MNDKNSTHPKAQSPNSVTRRSFLKLAAYGTSASLLAACAPTATTTSPGAAAPEAAVDAGPPASWENGMLRAGGNPQHGGTLRTAFGVHTQVFDIHQGGAATPLTQMYNGLVRNNPLNGLRTIVGELG